MSFVLLTKKKNDYYLAVVNAYYARKATTIHLLQCIAVNYGIISAGIDGREGGGKRGPRWR